jgi:hypothetical protein
MEAPLGLSEQGQMCNDCRYDDDLPEDNVICPRCDGNRIVDCHCGGDLCVCENYGEMDCPMCHGEGDVTKARADKYYARRREFAEQLREAMKSDNSK